MALIRDGARETEEERRRREAKRKQAEARQFQERRANQEAQQRNISVSPQVEQEPPERFFRRESAAIQAGDPYAYGQPASRKSSSKPSRQTAYQPEPQNVVDRIGELSSYIPDLASSKLERWRPQMLEDPYAMARYRAGEWMQDNSPFGRSGRDMSDLPPNPYRRAMYWAQERYPFRPLPPGSDMVDLPQNPLRRARYWAQENSPIRPNVLGLENGFYDEDGDPWPVVR